MFASRSVLGSHVGPISTKYVTALLLGEWLGPVVPRILERTNALACIHRFHLLSLTVLTLLSFYAVGMAVLYRFAPTTIGPFPFKVRAVHIRVGASIMQYEALCII